MLTAGAGYANMDVQAKYDARDPLAVKRLVALGAVLRPFSEEILEVHLRASNEVKCRKVLSNPDCKKIRESQLAIRNDEKLLLQIENTATKPL